MKTPCKIHYAAKNLMPDPKWRELRGIATIMGLGKEKENILTGTKQKGPKNMLVETSLGKVVVPRGNVRFERK